MEAASWPVRPVAFTILSGNGIQNTSLAHHAIAVSFDQPLVLRMA